MWLSTCIAVRLFLAVGLLTASCSRTGDDELIAREQATVKTWLEAGGALTTSLPKRIEAKSYKSAEWRARADLPWPELAGTLRQNKPAGYDRCDVFDRVLICSRSLPGDSIRIEVSCGTGSRPIELRIRISALPF